MAQCWCRKPRAGMVIEGAMRMFDQHEGEYYPPHLALFVGDRNEDKECAYNAHVAFMWAQDWRKEAQRLNEDLCCEHASERHIEGYLKVDHLRQAIAVCSDCDCKRAL
jgi:histidinol phosphatase-like enzyme